MKDKLTKNDIKLYLQEINKKLEEQNKHGEIILTGGAALTLVYDARDSTKDVDALFEPSKDMRDIIISISEKYNLNKDWLNDGVKGFMQPSMKIETIQKYGNLTVNSLDAESLLAMKLAAARIEIGIKDKEDAVILMKYLKIKKEEQLFDIVEKHVPKDKQTPKVYYFTQEVFKEYQKQQNLQKNNFVKSEELKDSHKKLDEKTLFNAHLSNKFNMTVEQNIFVAKRNIIDYMWKSAKLEGIAVTYPDTEAIYNGLTVQGISVKDTIAVNNLKHAWQFVLENIDYPIDYPFICKINQYVGGNNLIVDAGFIRKTPVTIGGTKWTPDMPIESIIKEELTDVMGIESPTDKAITLMLYCMRKQMFYDGNKRTAMLAGNQVMIAHGAGIISVPIEYQRDFTKHLVEFYQTNNMDEIKTFIYDKCIDGIEFENKIESPNQSELSQTKECNNKLQEIIKAPLINELPERIRDYQILFNAYAKAVLDETRREWTGKTNQLIAEKMLKNKVLPDQVRRALKYSPEPIKSISKFFKELENNPEIKAILRPPGGMRR